MGKIRILIVDDHAMFRDGLRAVLATQDDMALVGEASDADSAILLAAQLRPDVILMDLQLPGRSGIEATREIRGSQPSAKVVALTMYHDDAMVRAMISAGAQGYALKESRAADLLQAIRLVAAGGAAIEPLVAFQVLAQYREMASGSSQHSTDQLTERDVDLLRFLAAGESNRNIAASLHLSEQTVKNLLSGLYRKLGVKSRIAAVAVALRTGVIKQGR